MPETITSLLAANAQIEIMKRHSQIDDEYEAAAREAARTMPSAEWATLDALCKAGPLHDGDVPSKTGRDVLLTWGLASKAVVKGEQGYQCATYRGWDVWKAGKDARS